MKIYNEKLLEQMLEYIKTYQLEYGRNPTYRGIMNALKISSVSMVHRYLNILCERKLLQKNEFGEIEISKNISAGQTVLAPIVGVVTCGTPIYAQENIEGMYQLPVDIFGRDKQFLLHAQGDSMINAGIQDGDLLVIRQCDTAVDGEIVVALIEDSATVKRFYKKSDCVVLHPENEKYDDIVTHDVKILGKVQHCIHKF